MFYSAFLHCFHCTSRKSLVRDLRPTLEYQIFKKKLEYGFHETFETLKR